MRSRLSLRSSSSSGGIIIISWMCWGTAIGAPMLPGMGAGGCLLLWPVIWTSSSSSSSIHAKGGFSLSVSRASWCSFSSSIGCSFSSSYCCYSLLGGTLALVGDVLYDPVADEVAEILLVTSAPCLFSCFFFCCLPGPLHLSLLRLVIRQAVGGMLIVP